MCCVLDIDPDICSHPTWTPWTAVGHRTEVNGYGIRREFSFFEKVCDSCGKTQETNMLNFSTDPTDPISEYGFEQDA